MPLDTPPLPNGSQIPPGGPDRQSALHQKVAALNKDLRHHSAADVLARARRDIPRLALVSSFGAESVVLLHLAALVDRDLPVLFIDTEMLFTETLVYQQELTERLGLRRVTVITSQQIDKDDPKGTLHKTDPDACCALRKTAPLAGALRDYDGWITGRKRFQAGARAALTHFEAEMSGDAPARIKVNPLAYWTRDDLADYIADNRLPRHPMVARGYPSIGCLPCTSPARPDEDPRAGRWRNTSKDECGIHFANGKMVRAGE